LPIDQVPGYGGALKDLQEIKKLEKLLINDPGNTDILFHLARLSTEEHNIREATGYLERCLSLKPEHANARYQMGVICCIEGNYDYAVTVFRKLVDIDGDYRFSDVDFGTIAELQAATDVWKRFEEKEQPSPLKEFTLAFVHYALRNYDTSIKHSSSALEFNERLEQAHFILGLAHLEKKEYEAALKAFGGELAINPRSLGALFHAGIAHFRLGRMSPAIQHFQSVIQLRASHAKAHLYLGLCLASQSSFVQAEGHLMRAIESKPNFPDAHFHLGATYQAQFKMDEAITEYEYALKGDPRHKEAAVKLAEVKKNLGKLDEALSHLLHAASIAPDDASIFAQIGSIHFQRKEYGSAAEYLKKSLAIEPGNDAVLYTLGEALSHSDDLVNAAEAYRGCLALCPNDAAMRKALGNVLIKLDDIGGALVEFQRAVALNPKDIPSNLYAGISSLILGDGKNAREHFKRIAVETPKDPLVHVLLGAAQTKERGLEDGKRSFDEGIALIKGATYDSLFIGLLRLFAALGIEYNALPDQLDVLDMQKRGSSRSILLVFLNLLDVKYPHYRFHSQRVSRLAKMFALHLRKIDPRLLSDRQAADSEMGGLLHDIGMLGLPDFIVEKEGKLTPEESAVFRKHPREGEKMLQGIALPWDVVPVIACHHERWDGKGYPDGLAGDTIPIPVMVVALADFFDDLVTDRPGRKAFTQEEALRIIQKERDAAFPGWLLNPFLSIAPYIERYLADIPPWRR
jgi:tetratricopeptide (TPR) repeat protein